MTMKACSMIKVSIMWLVLMEVGRGPIAGPVTVAAVILPPMTLIPGLNDSKKLTEEKREALSRISSWTKPLLLAVFPTAQKRLMNSIFMKQRDKRCMRLFVRSAYHS